MGAFVTALVSAALAITTPPRSGVYCQNDCVAAPYTNVVRFVPRDYWWMYPLLLMLVAALLLAVAIHGLAAAGGRRLSLVGVCVTGAAVTVLAADYGIQLTTVQPALLAGETEDLSLWTQYNPHGLFIALENVGYAMLGIGFIFLGSALAARQPAPRGKARQARLRRLAGLALRVGGGLTLVALVGYAVVYGADLQYRFEVAAIALSWLTLLATGGLIGVAATRREEGPGVEESASQVLAHS